MKWTSYAKYLCFSALTLTLVGCSGEEDAEDTESSPVTFEITIENVSADADVSTPIAPGVWALHGHDSQPLFTVGEPAPDNGLEKMAEDGDPSTLMASVESDFTSGGFSLGSDAYDEGAAVPGDSFVFTFHAEPGQHLSFAAMFVESNDYFIGSPGGGLELFEGVEPIEGEVEIVIYNAGTEVDEPLGEGDNQPMRQTGPNTGDDEDGVVEDSGLDAEDYVTVTLKVVASSK